jgi:hypothetical protein
MKKLLFILSAIFVSVMGWGQLNPYAYSLSSDWDATNQTLTVDFKLNAKANKIEIFAVDRANNNKTYKIHEIASPGNTLDYSIPIHINGKDKNGTCLPTGKNLTFAVKVDGTASNNPGTPIYIEQNRPYSPHGVAVNNCQESQDFGAVYVTECTNGVSGNTWGWLSDKGRSLLEYNPRLEYSNFYRKSSDFSLRNLEWNSDGTYKSGGNLLEPHRVVISDDGRIFVSSYNQNGSNDKIAVWEFNRQTKQYTPLIYHNTAYGDRVVAMDIKGTTATGLKMILAFFEVNTDGNRGYYIHEYAISGNTGSATAAYVKKICQYVPSNGDGTQYQRIQDLLKESVNLHYFCYTDGFTDIAYGAKDPTTVFIGIDYFVNTKFRTTLDYYNGTNHNYHNTTNEGQRYGGGGLVTYKGANGEDLIAMGRCQLGNNTEDDGRIQVYALNQHNVPSDIRYTIPTKTKNVINDIAIDCANNLYAVSFTDNAATKAPSGTGRLLAVAMPYSGTVTTYCPTSNADNKEYFKLPARTNLPEEISATDLNTIVNNNSGGCGCDISLDRPMQANMFNTICLPFDLDLSNVASLSNADLMEFSGATLENTESGEKILTLNFSNVSPKNLKAYKPYLIKPTEGISSLNINDVNFVASGTTTVTQPITNVNNNSITFKGIVPSQTVTPKEVDGKSLTMMLVSDNRLAMMTEEGTMPGFRGYFEFLSTPPQGMQARISTSKNTTTGTEVVIDGQKVNIEKFLRDGRVYIRMGESLYNITGEKVEE